MTSSVRSASDRSASRWKTTYQFPEPEWLDWREEYGFRAWPEHGFIQDHSRHLVITEAYSEWQLLYLADALAVGDFSMPLADVVGEQKVAPPRDWPEAKVASAMGLDEAWQPTIKLLVALQPAFWPFRKNRVTLFTDVASGEHIDPHPETLDDFDGAALLRRFELNLDQLARLHWAFLEAALTTDPTPHLHGLLNLTHRRISDHLRGSALLTRDLYDASFLLRRLYHSITDEWLPATAHIPGTPTVQQWERRHLPPLDGGTPESRGDLQQLLLDAGIYPHRLHVVVEGLTEEKIVTRVVRMTGLGNEVRVTSLDGIDRAERQQALFEATSTYAERTVLIADREGQIEETIRRFQDRGLLTNDRDLLLWGSPQEPLSFEEANFSHGQIVQAMARAGRKRDGRLQLTAGQLRQAFKRQVEKAESRGLSRPALAKTALGLAQAPAHGAVNLSKGDLAEELLVTVERILRQTDGSDEAWRSIPLLEYLQQCLQEASRP